MPPTSPTSTSPFGQWLGARGVFINSLANRGTARRLSEKPDDVAPNSPTLVALGKELKVDLDEIRAFAKGKPMSAVWIKKVETQLANSGGAYMKKRRRATKHPTKSSGSKGKLLGSVVVKARDLPTAKPAKPAKFARGKHAKIIKHPFAKLIASKGMTMSAFAARLNLRPQVLWKLSSGDVPSNHPALPIIAAGLGLSAAEIGKYATLPPSHEGYIARTERMMYANGTPSNGKTGKAVVVAKHVAKNGKEMPERYNRLKKGALDTRQVARALATTLNGAIMRGEPVVPPLPVGALYVILADYFTEKGVPGAVLLDPRFAEFFDR